MSYSSINQEISSWVQKYTLKKLFTTWAGRDARFVYVSSPLGECFQISIEPPHDGRIKIHAVDIETHHDQEFRKDWEVSISEFRTALDEAMQTVTTWMGRDTNK